VRRRVREHHQDKEMHFSYITVSRTANKSKAKQIESKRLKSNKPPKNKQKE